MSWKLPVKSKKTKKDGQFKLLGSIGLALMISLGMTIFLACGPQNGHLSNSPTAGANPANPVDQQQLAVKRQDLQRKVQEFLWQNMKAIDVIESDHAPHTREESRSHLACGRAARCLFRARSDLLPSTRSGQGFRSLAR